VSDFIQSLADESPSHLKKEVERELINGWRMNEVNARKVAKQSGYFNRHNEARSIDGVGQKIASIPLDAWHYWGHRLGYECWEDKQFLKEFLRDNPETAVNNYVKRTCVNGTIFSADGTIIK
jgi:hypothetical protein